MRKLLLCSLLLVLLLSATGAWAITVVVNGEILPSSPPALERSNRVLLPLRVVFESLGAEVRWEAATRTITAVRADTTVTMGINRGTAYINDRAVILDVPPQLIGGNTYVPVRFPAEAFGADVGWQAATRTVTVSLPEGMPDNGYPPPPPPQPRPDQVTGIITSLSRDRIEVRVDSRRQVFYITPDTMIISQNHRALLDDLLPGDEVQVEYDARNNALVLEGSYDTVEGQVTRKTADTLEISTRAQVFRVLPTAPITTQEGRNANWSEVNLRDWVMLRVSPGSYNVSAIILQGQEEETSYLRITSDLSGILLSGDIYRLTVTGPSDGQATFSLGTWRQDMAMTEDPYQPGLYRATFVVPDLEAPRNEYLIVNLRDRNGRRQTVRSTAPLHFAPASQNEELPLRLLSPIYDDQVGDRLVVEGYTAPFARVSLTIDWWGPAGRGESGRLTSLRVNANARGYFITDPISLDVETTIRPENIRYRLNATARDQEGRNPTTVEVEFTQ